MPVDVVTNGHNEFLQVTEDSSFQAICGEITKEAFDHVQPGSVAASIWLSSEHVSPNVVGAPTKAKGHTILSLDELLYQFDAGKHDAGIPKRVKAEHRRSAEFDSAVILFHYIVQVLAAPDLHRVCPAKVKFVSHAHAP